MSSYTYAVKASRRWFEAQLTPRVQERFAEQGERIRQAILDAPGRAWALDAALAEADDLDLAADALAFVWGFVASATAAPTYEALAPAKSTIGASTKVFGEEIALTRTLGFIAAEGGVAVRSINDAVRSDLLAVLQRSADAGHSRQRMARELTAEWPELTDARAQRIVRTEVPAAQNYGTILGGEQAEEDFGLPMDKEWLGVPDDKQRDSHASAEGQRVGLRDLFSVGGYSARFPGDPVLPASERVNCRCTVAAVPAEVKKLTRTERRNRAIRADYPPLLERHGHQVAYDKLAEKYCLSPYTIKDIIYAG